MKKFIPYLLFSATTFHAFLGTLPATAMGCGTKTDNSEVICKDGDENCQQKVSESTIN